MLKALARTGTILLSYLRNRNQALFRAFTPSLLYSHTGVGISVVDAAGQHTTLTVNTHYGHIASTTPAALRMSLPTMACYTDISKVFQALLNLGSVPNEWADLLKSSRLLPTTEYLKIALWYARARVTSGY